LVDTGEHSLYTHTHTHTHTNSIIVDSSTVCDWLVYKRLNSVP
jgi:hypothetical protein